MLIKHSVRIAGHATSISLEEPFWQALCEIAVLQRRSVNAILAEIDRDRGGNLSSAIRLFVLENCRRGELSRRTSPVPADGGIESASVRAHPDRQNRSDTTRECGE